MTSAVEVNGPRYSLYYHLTMQVLVLTLCLVACAYGREHGVRETKLNTERVDFVATRLSAMRELETRLSYKGIDCMEVVIPSEQEDGLYYRELTDGKRLVQMIYKGRDHLADCDVSLDEADLARFYSRFLAADEVHPVGHRTGDVAGGNVTMRLLTGDLDDQLKELSNFKLHRRQCQAFIRELMKSKKGDSRDNKEMLQNGIADNSEMTHRRSKRSMFIYPGTKWCGRGSISTAYDDLGENIATDKCCRDHDHCPYVIEGFTSKFGIFNYRFHTLSHCLCDDR